MSAAPAGGDRLRPAEVCRELLAALEASEGRSRRRKRDQRPDQIGLALKRDLLEAVAREDPDPDGFEEWLLRRSLAAGRGSGAVRAMAISIFDEWRFAQAAPAFRHWLDSGAPSDDKLGPGACAAGRGGAT